MKDLLDPHGLWNHAIFLASSGALEAVCLVERFQSLIAGILALIGAIWTIRTITRQIRQTNDHEEERRRRKSFASRSALPLVLTNICDYARELAGFADCVYRKDLEGYADTKNRKLVEKYPYEHIEILKQCVEHADLATMTILSSLIRRIQFTRSRVRRSLNDLNLFDHMHEETRKRKSKSHLIDAVYLHAIALHIYEYADGNAEFISNSVSVDLLKVTLHDFWTTEYSGSNIALREEALNQVKEDGDLDILKPFGD